MTVFSKFGVLKSFFEQPQFVTNLVSKKLRLFQRYSWLKKNHDKDGNVPLPLIYELTLTYKCNLRCNMCMYWGETGWCINPKEDKKYPELNVDLIHKILNTSKEVKPSFILHGGEPLLHPDFSKIVSILKQNKCFSIVCTNGLLLDKFLDVVDDNPYIDLLVSLDGLEETNDNIRGKGVYKTVVSNIKLLKSLRYPPHIGIQFTILPENVNQIYSFCKKVVKLGVNWILINPCWFIAEPEKESYEKFIKENFSIDAITHLGYPNRYDIDPAEFANQYRKIQGDSWPIQISCYLNDPVKDIYDYINKPLHFTGNSFCYKQWVRMDITPEGKISPCIRYPDLIFGDLNIDDVNTIWNSDKFLKFRRLIRKSPTPLCQKCNCSYLYDPKRKHL